MIATMISCGCFDSPEKDSPSEVECTITLTYDQAKIVKKAIEQGKKVKITITD